VPVVALRVRVPVAVSDGQELEYHLFVENRSAAPAHHVLVRDPLPANARLIRAVPPPTRTDPELLWDLGTLGPCGRREILLVLAPTGPGEILNCARVQFEHGECVRTRVAGAEKPAAPADLALTKQGPAAVQLYDAVTYRLTVTNRGPTPAAGVRLTDTLPEGLEPVGNKGPLTWDIGTLSPGQERSVTYQVLAKKAGRWINRAVVTAAGGERREATATLLVRAAGLTADVEDQDDPVAVGAETKYTITVLNQSAAAATGVVVRATVPAEMEVRGAEGPAAHRQEGRQVVFGPITLPPHDEKVYEVRVKALRPGDVRFRVELTADQLTAGPVRREESTTIYNPSVPQR
jgi:uncharacterized repeat protein (TIGR01451 family)